MARPLRIVYENAWYHIMNRGANHKNIFTTDNHRKLFLSMLEEVVQNYAIEIHAYCLMDNHYHLLACTPHANLSQAMRHLNGVYTQKYNQMENSDGPLFRGRYKAILIQSDDYLTKVNRYIHLNPVSAGICDDPTNYTWSSYHTYIHQTNKMPWITTKYLLEEVGGVQAYIEFISRGIDDELQTFYNKKNISVILGKNKFKIEQLSEKNIRNEIEQAPDIKRAKYLPDIESIVENTANFFQINISDIIESKRSKLNVPRLFAIYLARSIGLYSYQKIGLYFKMNMYAVNSAIKRLEKRIMLDEKLNHSLQVLIQGFN